MFVTDGNFVVGFGPGTDYSYIHMLHCMLERTDAEMNEILEPITFFLPYPTVFLSLIGITYRSLSKEFLTIKQKPVQCMNALIVTESYYWFRSLFYFAVISKFSSQLNRAC